MDSLKAAAGGLGAWKIALALVIGGAGFDAVSRMMAFAFALFLGWCRVTPREDIRRLEGYFATALRCLIFLNSTIVKMWFEERWNMLVHDGPPDDMPIEGYVATIAHTLLVILYLLSLYLFSWIGAFLHFPISTL